MPLQGGTWAADYCARHSQMTACVQEVAKGCQPSGKQGVANSSLQHASSSPVRRKKKKIYKGHQQPQAKQNPNEDKDGRLAPETRRASCQERVGFCEHGGDPAIACVLGTGSKTRSSFTRHDHETSVPELRNDELSSWGATVSRCSWHEVAVSASKSPFAADVLSSSDYF